MSGLIEELLRWVRVAEQVTRPPRVESGDDPIPGCPNPTACRDHACSGECSEALEAGGPANPLTDEMRAAGWEFTPIPEPTDQPGHDPGPHEFPWGGSVPWPPEADLDHDEPYDDDPMYEAASHRAENEPWSATISGSYRCTIELKDSQTPDGLWLCSRTATEVNRGIHLSEEAVLALRDALFIRCAMRNYDVPVEVAEGPPEPTDQPGYDPGLDEECSCEPSLSDDELISVRQLIEERFGEEQNPFIVRLAERVTAIEQLDGVKRTAQRFREQGVRAAADFQSGIEQRPGTYSTVQSRIDKLAAATYSSASSAADGPSEVDSALPPRNPSEGQPNLTFPDPAEMHMWPDWLVMGHAANCLLWPEHKQLVDELRKRADLNRDGTSGGVW